MKKKILRGTAGEHIGIGETEETEKRTHRFSKKAHMGAGVVPFSL
jgi:hypothetical protein